MPLFQVKNLIAISGFLGKKEEWNSFKSEEFGVAKISPLAPCQMPAQSFTHFSEKILELTESGNANILLGYSLGGRLALHALLSSPGSFSAAIIISAHPGLETEKEKTFRKDQDAFLANQFLVMPWENLMKKWDSQAIFKNSKQIKRYEKDFNRTFLAQSLLNYSLGCQENLREQISRLNLPLLWVVGDQDQKFSGIAKKITLYHPSSAILSIPGAGHRVPWDEPMKLQKAVYSFLSNI